MSRKVEIDAPKLLIVEGRDEELFFGALLRDHLGRDDVQVLPIGGKTLLRDNLQALIRDPRFSEVEAIGVIRDADVTPPGSDVPAAERAWESVSSALRDAAIPVPAGHAAFSTGSPRAGIFIVPDGRNDGMLESLCLAAVGEQPEYSCVDDYFDCLATHAIRPNNVDKARVHAYLASRIEPDRRLGEAAQAGYWPWESTAFAPLVKFVRQS